MGNPSDPVVPSTVAEDNPFRWPNANALQAPAAKYVPIVADTPFDCCRAIWCGTAGAATITDATGVVRSAFPLQVGLNPIGATLVASSGITAGNLWALY